MHCGAKNVRAVSWAEAELLKITLSRRQTPEEKDKTSSSPREKGKKNSA